MWSSLGIKKYAFAGTEGRWLRYGYGLMAKGWGPRTEGCECGWGGNSLEVYFVIKKNENNYKNPVKVFISYFSKSQQF